MTIRYVVRSAAISGFRVEAGDAADLLLRKAGIDPALLDSEDHQIEIEQLQRLLAEAAEHLQRPDFGMRVAQHQGRGCAEFCVTGDGVTTVAACLRS